MERWTKEETEYLIDNFQSKKFSEIAKVIGKTEGTIRAKCFDLQLVKNSRWCDYEIEFLKEKFSILTYKDIAQSLNRTETSVRMKAKKLGLKKELIQYDRDFFDIVDTEEKAYWLGFIYADGWVTLDNEDRGCLRIELQQNDIEHLKKFNKSIKGNIEVKTRMSNASHIDGREIKSYPMCYIRLFSEKIVHDLNKYGVHPKKTYDLMFSENIPDELVRHVIRGYFDGDGCITKQNHKNGKQYVKCDFSCKSINMLIKLREILYNNDIKSYICQDKGNYRLYIGGLNNVDKFLNFIYKDSTIYLQRKYDKTSYLYKTLDILERLPRKSEMVC